jgi:hypothetical protein
VECGRVVKEEGREGGMGGGVCRRKLYISGECELVCVIGSILDCSCLNTLCSVANP